LSMRRRPIRVAHGVLILCAIGLTCCDSTPPSAAKKAGPRNDCASCHMRDYLAVRDPPHEGVRPTRCAVCHLETSWSPSRIDHPWRLTGAHTRAACFACHQGRPVKFEGTDSACVACHRTDYDHSEYPGHDQFALTCGDCHSTAAWRPAEHPHAAHSPATASPQLQAAGTHPQQAAHTIARAKRDHPENLFPIAGGAHSGIDCATCHDQPGATAKNNTDCVRCHKRARFDPKHSDVSAYPTGPAPVNFCVECHTRGRVHPVAH
jgi:hypothetical protein